MKSSRFRLGAAEVFLSFLLPAAAQSITVDDSSDTLHSPGCATTGASPCTLRDAITYANTNPGPDVINFGIAGAGVHTITPASGLPPFMGPVTVDGYSQPGASPNTNPVGQGLNGVLLIEINLANTSGTPIQFNSTAAGSTIKGLVINRSVGAAVVFNPNSTGNTIQGCYIGTNPSGTAAGPGNNDGLVIGSANNLVGGTFPEARNLFSGNHDAGIAFGAVPAVNNNIIQGNLIGTNAAGTAAVQNDIDGISLAESTAMNTLIGGTVAGARNVISGNGVIGIEIWGNGSTSRTPGAFVQGNLIGTDITGTLALGNGSAGISIEGANLGNQIGGTTAAERNEIAANGTYGVAVSSVQNVVSGNFIGTNAAGTAGLGGHVGGGVVVAGNHNTIGGTAAGAGNVIAYSASGLGGDGVALFSSTMPTGVAILGNSIHDNAGRGISLNGGNSNQPAPVITGASIGGGNVTVTGTLSAAPSTTYRVEIFSNTACDSPIASGEGRSYLGFTNVLTDGSGHGLFGPVPFPIPGGQTVITGTATNPVNSTSAFSGCFTASSSALSFFSIPPCRVVDTRNAAGPYGGPAIVANTDRSFVFTGQCGVPVGARAVVINIAVTLSTAGGDLRLFPTGSSLPLVSAINYNAGKTRANDAIIRL
jgi:hypothetical protein